MGKFAKKQILGWKLGWKVKLKVIGTQPGIFRGRTGFLEQKDFDKHFMHKIQKKSSSWKIFLVFSSRYSLNCISSENLTPKCTQIFSNIKVLFFYFKKRQGKPPNLPLSSCAPKLIYFLKKRLIQHQFFLQDNVQIQQKLTFDFKKLSFTWLVAAILV